MSTHASVPLGEVCKVNPRGRKARGSGDLRVSFVPMAAVDERWGEIRDRETRPLAEVARGYSSFRTGDVLFAKITPCMENGKVAVARALTNGIGRGSTEFYVLRPGDSILADYLFFYLRQPSFRKQAKRHFTGTAGQQRVPKSFIENATILLPPLDEQRRIVAILNRAAKIERLRARAGERLREFVPALFVKMFGDPLENPMGWRMQRLQEVCVSARYGTSKKASETAGAGVPVIRMSNVTYNGDLDCADLKFVVLSDTEFEKHALRAGDILFNRTNSRELVGKTGVWDGRFEAVAASYFIRLRPDAVKVCPSYAWGFFNVATTKHLLYGMARGAIGQANINATEVQSILLPVPPIELQRRFAELVDHAQDSRNISKSCITGASALTQSLMGHLLSTSREGSDTGLNATSK